MNFKIYYQQLIERKKNHSTDFENLEKKLGSKQFNLKENYFKQASGQIDLSCLPVFS